MPEDSPETVPYQKIGRKQKSLTAEQEACIRQLVDKRMAAHLSLAPINEQEAEAHLYRAYQVAGLEPPFIRWFDSPFAFLSQTPDDKPDSVLDIVQGEVERRMWTSLGRNVRESIRKSIDWSVTDDKWLSLAFFRGEYYQTEGGLWYSVRLVGSTYWENGPDNVWTYSNRYLHTFTLCHVYHEMCEENDLIHLARLSELVSGYSLGLEEAWIVRKPTRLEWDDEGNLHGAEGPCVEYRDGWKFYAWHGVEVPAKVILYPEDLTWEDWLYEPNVEVRRIIQERMPNFVEEVDGRFIDEGTRGILYAVDLVGDPEQVAHYVQVYDPLTQRIYYLRVPPSIRRADEAVAWTFGLSEQDYQPEQET